MAQTRGQYSARRLKHFHGPKMLRADAPLRGGLSGRPIEDCSSRRPHFFSGGGRWGLLGLQCTA